MYNNKVKLLAILLLAVCATTGCSKKDDLKSSTIVFNSTHSATYVVDGRQYFANPQTDEEWAAFLDRMFALAEEGRTVHFWRTESNVQASKDIVTFTTKNKVLAQEWTAEKMAQGYDVTIFYNPQTGEYTCTAIK